MARLFCWREKVLTVERIIPCDGKLGSPIPRLRFFRYRTPPVLVTGPL
jgi:hypothetical protein